MSTYMLFDDSQNISDLPLSISKDEIRMLPLLKYEGEVRVISDDHSSKEAIAKLESETVLGFDTESRPAFEKGQYYHPSLLQLAAADCVYIFQLQQIEDLSKIYALLSNPEILKAGVAIADDIKRLDKLYPFSHNGFMEISELSTKLGFHNTGLRPLTGILFNKRISKGAQRSNWANENLTPTQIDYAATDAWISRELYLALNQLDKKI